MTYEPRNGEAHHEPDLCICGSMVDSRSADSEFLIRRFYRSLLQMLTALAERKSSDRLESLVEKLTWCWRAPAKYFDKSCQGSKYDRRVKNHRETIILLYHTKWIRLKNNLVPSIPTGSQVTVVSPWFGHLRVQSFQYPDF